jgi:GAF domain-containing protein
MHDSERGLISVYDVNRDNVQVLASVGFSPAALAALRDVRGGEGACGMACATRTRVFVEDTERDARFAPFRELARAEGFRAVHSTPLVSRDGEVLGALSVHFNAPHKPSEREIRLADICARKAAVFIERARAEDRVNQRDRRFESVLSASGVPFVMLSPVRDSDGKIRISAGCSSTPRRRKSCAAGPRSSRAAG